MKVIKVPEVGDVLVHKKSGEEFEFMGLKDFVIFGVVIYLKSLTNKKTIEYICCKPSDIFIDYEYGGHKKQVKKFSIAVRRYADEVIEVEADNFENARDKAVEVACNKDWNNADYFYMTADEDNHFED